jgi:hypothetical protein
MCTKEETINTGINIDAVNASKLNPHNILSDSESIHVNSSKVTGILFIPTSKNTTIDNNVVITTELHVIH